MDRGNTKEEILDASLELFSVQGFEATSISQISGAVGIRKASLYSHFENKQAILDALVKEVLEQYGTHSIFAGANQEKDAGGLPKKIPASNQDAEHKKAAQVLPAPRRRTQQTRNEKSSTLTIFQFLKCFVRRGQPLA